MFKSKTKEIDINTIPIFYKNNENSSNSSKYESESEFKRNIKTKKLETGSSFSSVVSSELFKINNKNSSFLADSGFEVVQSLTLSRTNIIEASIFQGSSPKISGLLLQNYLTSINTDEKIIIQLPGKSFELTELNLINKNVVFIGSAGTQICINQGEICIKNSTVSFKECSIVLSYNKNIAKLPKIKNPKCLFEITENSELNLSDCLLKADYFNEIPIKSEVIPNLICIYINQHENPGKIRINSCSFMHFFSHIVGVKPKDLIITECGFFKCLNSAILIIDPENLHISNSKFENCTETGIELRFTHEIISSLILIDSNKISKCGANGISVSGEKLLKPIFLKENCPCTTLEINIKNNKISECRLDSIFIRNLQVFNNGIKLILQKNNIFESERNGISIVSILSKSLVKSKINLTENCIENCKGNGMNLLEINGVIKIVECICLYNIQRGILVYMGPGAKNEKIKKKFKIENCIVRENTNGGIGIFDMLDQESVFIRNCIINTNGEYGLVIGNLQQSQQPMSNNINQTTKSISMSSILQNNLSNTLSSPYYLSKEKTSKTHVMLQSGEIVENLRGGIFLGAYQLFIEETKIKFNGSAAIFMETSRGKTHFSKKTIAKKSIVGIVRTKYNEINIYSKNEEPKSCCVSFCSIF